MHYATPEGSIPLDFELYLPASWTNDQDRCRKAGIPVDVVFRTKWELGLTMLDRGLTWGLDNAVASADAGYGKVSEFRDGLTERKVYGDQEPPSVLQVAQSLPPEAWKTVAWDQGSRGLLQSRFAALRVHPSHGYHQGKPLRPQEWLLIEWPEGQEKPEHYWLSTLPDNAALLDLVRKAKWRWHIEQDCQQLKDELGLDHFEGRSWIGWHRHVTMTMVAFGLLVLERLRGAQKGLRSGPSLDAARNPSRNAAPAGHLDRGVLRLWLPGSQAPTIWKQLTEYY